MKKDYDPCEWCSCTREQCLECKNYSEELAKIVDEHRILEEEEVLSDCCTAPIIYHDICSQCKEHI